MRHKVNKQNKMQHAILNRTDTHTQAQFECVVDGPSNYKLGKEF